MYSCATIPKGSRHYIITSFSLANCFIRESVTEVVPVITILRPCQFRIWLWWLLKFFICLKSFSLALTTLQMRAMMTGLWYTVYGLTAVFGTYMYNPFSHIPASFCTSCGFYCFLAKIVIFGPLLLSFLFLSKRHRLREKNIPVTTPHELAEVNRFTHNLCSMFFPEIFIELQLYSVCINLCHPLHGLL